MSPNDPFPVVRVLEFQEGKMKPLYRVEPPNPKQVILQGPNEPLSDAVALGFSDERWRTLDAQKGNLLLKHAGNALTTVAMPQSQAFSHCGAKDTKAMAHALANRLQGFETRPALGGVDADTLQRTVILRQEDRCVAFRRSHRRGRVRAPHSMHSPYLDRPVMCLGA